MDKRAGYRGIIERVKDIAIPTAAIFLAFGIPLAIIGISDKAVREKRRMAAELRQYEKSSYDLQHDTDSEAMR